MCFYHFINILFNIVFIFNTTISFIYFNFVLLIFKFLVFVCLFQVILQLALISIVDIIYYFSSSDLQSQCTKTI